MLTNDRAIWPLKWSHLSLRGTHWADWLWPWRSPFTEQNRRVNELRITPIGSAVRMRYEAAVTVALRRLCRRISIFRVHRLFIHIAWLFVQTQRKSKETKLRTLSVRRSETVEYLCLPFNVKACFELSLAVKLVFECLWMPRSAL